MKHIGLFEGIGGFSLSARYAGWETIAWCEWDAFCQTVLKYHFPHATPHSDIRTTDFTGYYGKVDILTGGFPCQPYSTAGKRKGTDDERHLWPEMLRAIREISPRWVVGENVGGLISWSGGLVFEQVQTDLEVEGYEVQAFVLPACGVNAPHRRDRVWFVARRITADTDSDGHKLRGLGQDRSAPVACEGFKKEWERVWPNAGGIGEPEIIADTNGSGRGQQLAPCQPGWQEFGSGCGNEGLTSSPGSSRRLQINSQSKPGFTTQDIPNWRGFPTQSPICGRNDGFSPELAGITVSKHRRESIKAYGNAIVPHVALQIFKAINEIENR